MLPFQIDLDSTDSAVPSTPCRTCNPDWCRSHRGELNAALANAENLRARAARYSGLVADIYNQGLIIEVETLALELDGEARTLELESCLITAPWGAILPQLPYPLSNRGAFRVGESTDDFSNADSRVLADAGKNAVTQLAHSFMR